MKRSDIIIVGAGLSGLTAAKLLKASGRNIRLIDASDGIGGRVRTDNVEGFQLDRGFQVLLTAYPEAKKLLNYRALDLRCFEPGAVILNESGSSLVSDPLRQPSRFWQTLMSGSGSFKDKILMLRLKQQLKQKQTDDIFSGKLSTALAYLDEFGFSEKIIHNFFKPFFGGVFLEDELDTSANMFEFLFKMFSEGDTAVPAAGMGMIAKQLAETLSKEEIVLNERVVHIAEGSVLTDKGHTFEGDYILVATDENSIPLPLKNAYSPGRCVTNIYFTTEPRCISSKMVLLNASAGRVVNNFVALDNISPLYAPDGKSLISVSLIADHRGTPKQLLLEQVINELVRWYPCARHWRHLATYYIPYALPVKSYCRDNLPLSDLRISERIFRCGDYLLNGSINAALKSGRIAAESILSL